MRNRIVLILTAIALAALMVAPSMVLAGARIQDEGEGTVSLDSVGEDTPEQATGTVKFELKKVDDGYVKLSYDAEVKNLPRKAGRIYVAWLIDDETGFSRPLGVFQTDRDGDAKRSGSGQAVFFAPFNKIQVTSEELNDQDPGRSGPVVLEGTVD